MEENSTQNLTPEALAFLLAERQKFAKEQVRSLEEMLKKTYVLFGFYTSLTAYTLTNKVFGLDTSLIAIGALVSGAYLIRILRYTNFKCTPEILHMSHYKESVINKIIEDEINRYTELIMDNNKIMIMFNSNLGKSTWFFFGIFIGNLCWLLIQKFILCL